MLSHSPSFWVKKQSWESQLPGTSQATPIVPALELGHSMGRQVSYTCEVLEHAFRHIKLGTQISGSPLAPL